MIIFRTVRWKNLLATGSQFTEVQLNRSPSTLITGKNGNGKSTIIEALCVGLFGKPFRNINKPQLVNSINKKDCVIEIEFDIGEKKYKIIRGIKPNIFEIYLNGELLNQDAAARDYQIYLEDHVLKLNYKSFTQIVILGSATFVPFMQLPTAHRREIIEDLLDINIFSLMNANLKERLSEIKDQAKNIQSDLSIIKNKVEVQDKYVKTLESDNKAKLEEINNNIEESDIEIKKIQVVIDEIQDQKTKLQETITDKKDINDQYNILAQNKRTITSKINDIKEQMEFFHENENCPVCKQELDPVHEQRHINDLNGKIGDFNKQLYVIAEDLDKLKIRIDAIDKVEDQISILDTIMSEHKNKTSGLKQYIIKLQRELQNSQSNVNITDEKMKLKDMAKEALFISKKQTEINEDKYYHDICATLLKDGGIKTRIIKQYLPAINKLINKYLSEMDLFISFELNENFEETIKSRHRDDFTYASFSEGEKNKIDLAILFTWRNIARLKNSANTNLLICDEVLDGALDGESTESLLKIFGDLESNVNLFVITHSPDQYSDKFRSSICFEKVNNYSVIK